MLQKIKVPVIISVLTILALVLVEIVSKFVLLPIAGDIRHDRRSDLNAYSYADYDVDLLIKEISESSLVRYTPYILWRRQPFSGELVNVDEDGNRLTLNNSQRDDAMRVWMFGGSTTWGWGIPDAETIPSQLSKRLNEEWGIDASVINFGEDAYVSTQEVVNLVRELQTGERPDLVIFYDGSNDATAAVLWPQIPGAHHNLDAIQSRFDGVKPSFAQRVRSTGTFSVSAIALRQIGIDLLAGPSPAHTPDDDNGLVDLLADRALNVWLENNKTVTALGEGYGFTPVFFFQPAMGLEQKPLDPSEQTLLDGLWERPEGQGIQIHKRMLESIRGLQDSNESVSNIYDITDSFSDVRQPVYLDWTHVTGPGNGIIADKILEIIQTELCRKTPPNASDHTRQQLTSACGSAARN